ncbi:MAG: TetR/AcrR family transcriptional regulator, partial [Thermotaleaceae bacterium]
ELFSEKGFNATSVNMIAEKAEVNKALIYYHFKDKNDIINSMFENIIKESDDYINKTFENSSESGKAFNKQEAIGEEIKFMLKRKNILSVMMMEALKGADKDNYFFKCADSVFKNHLKMFEGNDLTNNDDFSEFQRQLVYEFFMGFVPMVTFAVFHEKWCEYFECDSEKATEYFWDSFNRTHLAQNK